jgi:hypothetical protein
LRGLIHTAGRPAAQAAGALLFLLLAFSPTAQAASKNAAPAQQPKIMQLDEATLKEAGERYTKGMQRKDISAFAEGLADDIVITIEMMGQFQTLNKAEYLAQIKRNWTKIADYEFKPTGGEVSMDSPTRATVRLTAMESMLFNDVILKCYNEQENVVELRNGRPLTTQVNMHLSVYASVKL